MRGLVQLTLYIFLIVGIFIVELVKTIVKRKDDQIGRQQTVTSNAQMYKQHGNGIVAQVIGLIIGMAYYDDENELREKVMANSHMWNKEKGE